MRKSGLLLVALILIAALLAGGVASQAKAAAWVSTFALSGALPDRVSVLVTEIQLSLFQAIHPEVAVGPLLPATTKCITIGGRKFCKDFGHKDKDKGAPAADSKSEAPVSKCALGTHSDGQCVCPAGQVNHADGSCGKPCGYGMSGVPPKCRCVTGATLQVTGPLTKACLCPDGNKPEEVDGNYACQNLGPQ